MFSEASVSHSVTTPEGGGVGMDLVEATPAVGTQPTGMHSCFFWMRWIRDVFKASFACSVKKQLYWFHSHLVRRYCSLQTVLLKIKLIELM